MREYYSILGISRKSSDSEIVAAYRKLSAKFHPEYNAGDPFFTERYKELQEAYNVLINPLKRSAYDAELDPRFSADVSVKIDNEKPIITVFEISKKAITEGEPLTIRWQTIHADDVFIDCIGKVEAEGTKTVRLPMLNDKERLLININANNSHLSQKVNKQLEVKNKSFNEKQSSNFGNDLKRGTIKEPLNIELDDERTVESPKIEKKIKPTEKPIELSQDKTKEEKKQETKNVKKTEPVKIVKERVLSKEERLSGISNVFEEEEVRPQLGFRDVYIYIVLIVLLVFVAIMAIFAYNMNPLS